MNSKSIFFSIFIIMLIGLFGCGGGGESVSSTSAAESNVQPTNSNANNQGSSQGSESSNDEAKESDSDNEESSKSPTSHDLVAADDFNFRTDQAVTVNVSGLPVEQGKLVFYHGFGFYDETSDIHYPAYENRLTSSFAINGTEVTMQVDGNWQHLTIEWLPMNANFNEVYRAIELDGSNSYSLSFE